MTNIYSSKTEKQRQIANNELRHRYLSNLDNTPMMKLNDTDLSSMSEDDLLGMIPRQAD